MQIVQRREHLGQIHEQAIADAISSTMDILEAQYQEAYQATLHGWFVVCEGEKDLTDPFTHLTFSLAEKLNTGEVEFVEKKQDWYEVYIMLNDNEGILVYVPNRLFLPYQLNVI
ncbi:hypothetical protein SKM57_08800 [Acinetobacter faecalis]|uniref:hypothetical protein n=1 Tax=Acinetobacter faecalis TaxID=2665161 RepID=UPI002A914FF6|nr:hypothetical protein [Acinetobacter faecalis]MDY6468672.1 hypothetical protein [Acinetobacter faecalis]